MKFSDYISLLRQRFIVVVLIVLATTGAALGLAAVQKPTFQATARLRVRPVAPASQLGEFLRDQLRFSTTILTEAELVKSQEVAERVLERVPLPGVSAPKLLRSLQVVAVSNTEILLVTVDYTDPKKAKDLANAFADEYVAVRRDQARSEAQQALGTISTQVQQTQDELNDLDAQLDGLTTGDPRYLEVKSERDSTLTKLAFQRAQLTSLVNEEALSLGVGDIIERAILPPPSGKNLPRNGVLGLLIGFPMALGVVLLLDSMSNTVKTKEDAEAITESDVLGLIPHDSGWRDDRQPRLVSVTDPLSPVAEAYRMLQINMMSKATGRRRILVTSPEPGEGKSTTAANLAMSLAQAGSRTLLVSADLRTPRAHQFIGVNQRPGLSDVLTGNARLHDAIIQNNKGLGFVPSGTPAKRPDLLFSHARLEELFADLDVTPADAPAGAEGTADIVIIDAPPILQAAEVSSLAACVDDIVLVVRCGRTGRAAAQEAAEQIRQVGGHLLGVVVIGVDASGSRRSRRPYYTETPEGATANGAVTNGAAKTSNGSVPAGNGRPAPAADPAPPAPRRLRPQAKAGAATIEPPRPSKPEAKQPRTEHGPSKGPKAETKGAGSPQQQTPAPPDAISRALDAIAKTVEQVSKPGDFSKPADPGSKPKPGPETKPKDTPDSPWETK